jgi:hypothetical protein
MMEHAVGLAVRHTMTVPLDTESAFELFTAGMGTWWPAHTDHHLSDVPATAMMESRERGRLYERDERGREFGWGLVRVWEPPARVVFGWHLSPEWCFDADPAMATEVEVVFERSGDHRTRVSFEHRGFEVHGEAGRALCDSLGGEDGWLEVLREYERAAA